MKKVFTIILMALAITAMFVSCDDPKHEHSYDATKWESDGTSHWHVCTTCGEKVDVANHTLETTEAREPTCTEKGWDEYVTCSVCDYSTYKEKPALGHDYTSDGKCTRCTADNLKIASIGDTEYTSLASAITASQESETIKLLQNITLKESLDVTKSVALDLDGKIITVSGSNSIKVGVGGKIELINISPGQKDFVSSETKISLSNKAIYSSFDAALKAASSGATITLLSDVTLEDDSNPISISKDLTINLANKKLDLKNGALQCSGTIKFMNGNIVSTKGNEDPVSGSYVIGFKGSLTFEKVEFNQTGLACTILYTEEGNLSIINSQFNCVARDSVVATYYGETTVTITGSKIFNNASTGNVKYIYNGTTYSYSFDPTVLSIYKGTCKIENSEIKGTGNGAQAVNATGATVTISGSSTIIEGTSKSLVIGSGSTATVSDSFIKGDCVVSVTDGTCDITNSTIETTNAETTTLYVEAKRADASLKLSSVKSKSVTSVKVEKKNASEKKASLTNNNVTCEGDSLTLESVSE